MDQEATITLADRVHVVVSRKGDDSPVYEESRGLALVEAEFYIGTCYCHVIITLSASQARVARREHEELGTISVAIFNRYLHHRLRGYEMEVVVMISLPSS